MEIIRSIYVNGSYLGECRLQKDREKFKWYLINSDYNSTNKKLFVENRKAYPLQERDFYLIRGFLEFFPSDLEV